MNLFEAPQEDALAMHLIINAVNAAPSSNPLEIIDYAARPEVLEGFLGKEPAGSEKFSIDQILDRCDALLTVVEQQTHSLLTSAKSVITVRDTEHVGAVLHSSEHLGLMFGRVAAEPARRGEKSNDWHVLDLIAVKPAHYLAYDGSIVRFNEAGQSLLTADRPSQSGCPALGQKHSRSDLPNQNLYRLFWQGEVRRYMRFCGLMNRLVSHS